MFLDSHQLERFRTLCAQTYLFQDKSLAPIFQLPLFDFLSTFVANLSYSVRFKGIYLKGGAALMILTGRICPLADLDLHIEIESPHNWNVVEQALFTTLALYAKNHHFDPQPNNRHLLGNGGFARIDQLFFPLLKNRIKVEDSNCRFSLHTLPTFPYEIDIQCVDYLKKSCFTSADAVQIDLTKFLLQREIPSVRAVDGYEVQKSLDLISHGQFYIQSLESIDELLHGIYGYCRILSRGYRPSSLLEIEQRFWKKLISEDLSTFQSNLVSYLKKHYSKDPQGEIVYLLNFMAIGARCAIGNSVEPILHEQLCGSLGCSGCMPAELKQLIQFVPIYFYLRFANPTLYPGRLETWNLGCAKAPRLNDRKSVHISNIDRLAIVQSRELSRQSKSKFQTDRGIITESNHTNLFVPTEHEYNFLFIPFSEAMMDQSLDASMASNPLVIGFLKNFSSTMDEVRSQLAAYQQKKKKTDVPIFLSTRSASAPPTLSSQLPKSFAEALTSSAPQVQVSLAHCESLIDLLRSQKDAKEKAKAILLLTNVVANQVDFIKSEMEDLVFNLLNINEIELSKNLILWMSSHRAVLFKQHWIEFFQKAIQRLCDLNSIENAFKLCKQAKDEIEVFSVLNAFISSKNVRPNKFFNLLDFFYKQKKINASKQPDELLKLFQKYIQRQLGFCPDAFSLFSDAPLHFKQQFLLQLNGHSKVLFQSCFQEAFHLHSKEIFSGIGLPLISYFYRELAKDRLQEACEFFSHFNPLLKEEFPNVFSCFAQVVLRCKYIQAEKILIEGFQKMKSEFADDPNMGFVLRLFTNQKLIKKIMPKLLEELQGSREFVTQWAQKNKDTSILLLFDYKKPKLNLKKPAPIVSKKKNNKQIVDAFGSSHFSVDEILKFLSLPIHDLVNHKEGFKKVELLLKRNLHFESTKLIVSKLSELEKLWSSEKIEKSELKDIYVFHMRLLFILMEIQPQKNEDIFSLWKTGLKKHIFIPADIREFWDLISCVGFKTRNFEVSHQLFSNIDQFNFYELSLSCRERVICEWLRFGYCLDLSLIVEIMDLIERNLSTLEKVENPDFRITFYSFAMLIGQHNMKYPYTIRLCSMIESLLVLSDAISKNSSILIDLGVLLDFQKFANAAQQKGLIQKIEQLLIQHTPYTPSLHGQESVEALLKRVENVNCKYVAPYLNAILQKDNKNKKALDLLFNVYNEFQKFDDALKIAKQRYEAYPKEFASWFMRGVAHCNLNQWKEGLVCLNLARHQKDVSSQIPAGFTKFLILAKEALCGPIKNSS